MPEKQKLTPVETVGIRFVTFHLVVQTVPDSVASTDTVLLFKLEPNMFRKINLKYTTECPFHSLIFTLQIYSRFTKVVLQNLKEVCYVTGMYWCRL